MRASPPQHGTAGPHRRGLLAAGLVLAGGPRAWAQARPPQPVLPAFDQARSVLLKAVLASDGFRRRLAGQAPALPRRPDTRFRPDDAHAVQEYDAFLALSLREMDAAFVARARTGFVAGDMFVSVPLTTVPAESFVGTDLIDHMTQFLIHLSLVTIHGPAQLPGYDEAAFEAQFLAVRGQALAGCADAPDFLALSEAQLRGFALWLSFNAVHLGDVIDRVASGRHAEASARYPRTQERCRAILHDAGVDWRDLRLGKDGLRSLRS